ncbi:pyrroloquinoline quinone biosynthesis peptide chaperone PqqD [Caballeronia sp. Lep1P3]|uniref:pyrroloquinoline quinone biosynthesis peptide chaperone PqqD n=1 Tax=Caballeronia sp. Lep1P3 TaxID=2878150 RepID=UPI001FD0E712|nr:pyrroloquinoline quinone biosynthesis peptide chaperone PqqD [Caballeronia sp. Lep1P3]
MSDTNPTQRVSEAVAAPDDSLQPKLKRLFRLQWEPAQDAHVLLYPEGMVKLNESAAQILLRCDGTRDIPALIADLEAAFGASGIGDDVRAFIAGARSRGWLE